MLFLILVIVLLIVVPFAIVVPFVIVAILLLLLQTWVKMKESLRLRWLRCLRWPKTLWLQNTLKKHCHSKSLRHWRHVESTCNRDVPYICIYRILYVYVYMRILYIYYITYIYITYKYIIMYNICFSIFTYSLFILQFTDLLPVKSIPEKNCFFVSWRSGSMSAKAGITVAGRARVVGRSWNVTSRLPLSMQAALPVVKHCETPWKWIYTSLYLLFLSYYYHIIIQFATGINSSVDKLRWIKAWMSSNQKGTRSWSILRRQVQHFQQWCTWCWSSLTKAWCSARGTWERAKNRQKKMKKKRRLQTMQALPPRDIWFPQCQWHVFWIIFRGIKDLEPPEWLTRLIILHCIYSCIHPHINWLGTPNQKTWSPMPHNGETQWQAKWKSLCVHLAYYYTIGKATIVLISYQYDYIKYCTVNKWKSQQKFHPSKQQSQRQTDCLE